MPPRRAWAAGAVLAGVVGGDRAVGRRRVERVEGPGRVKGVFWNAHAPVDLEVRLHCVAEFLSVAFGVGGRTLAEFGAGAGDVAAYVAASAETRVDCYDASRAAVNASGGRCVLRNLAKRGPALPRVDTVYSIETGEHVPREAEAAFLDNVAATARRAVALSWAHPGQAGPRAGAARNRWRE